MQLYVANLDGTRIQPITSVKAGSCAMHGHWQQGNRQKNRKKGLGQ
jgi:hypothetical protein